MKKTVLLKILAFLLVGEALIRFDEATLFFSGSRVETIENKHKPSEELARLRDGTFTTDSSVFHVMLLGDSKLYGVGVPADSVFSRRLRTMLRSQHLPGVADVSVLDLTIPGGNTYLNTKTFFEFYDAYRPDVVILGYNSNDVYSEDDESPASEPTGLIASREPASAVAHEGTNPQPGATESHDWSLEVVRVAKRIVSLSRLLDYVVVNLNMELKLVGVVVPGTEFDHLIHQSHEPASPGWRRSQADLRTMAGACATGRSRFVMLVVPQLEMLAHYAVFGELDSRIEDFARRIGADYMNGVEPFLERTSTDYSISRYDGHPNEAAHRILAGYVCDRIATAHVK